MRRLRRLLVMLIVGLWLSISSVACTTGPDGSVKTPGFLEGLLPPTPSEAARDAFNVSDPDKRRRAVMLISNAEWGGQPEYVRMYRLLVDDPDPTVRAACLAALGRHGEVSDVSTIVRYTRDDRKPVRWEAAKALQRLHSDLAIDPLIRLLNEDEHPDVRIAAASALAQYRQRRVFDALVGALNDRDYGVVVEAEKSLHTLTGQRLGLRPDQWIAWAGQQTDLFADAEPYYYPQFDKPPTLVDRAMFWKPGQSITPRQPRGVAGMDTDDESVGDDLIIAPPSQPGG